MEVSYLVLLEKYDQSIILRLSKRVLLSIYLHRLFTIICIFNCFLSFADASVVLTEDTDSFIIGDRVWVGGTKGGHISYIGETQFAPGEWAGVTLDEPIGKYLLYLYT